MTAPQERPVGAKPCLDCGSMGHGRCVRPQERPVAGDGLDRIAAERRRQVEVEGWTPDHDAEHDRGQLSRAAACYADAAHAAVVRDDAAYYLRFAPGPWPWHDKWWKPSDDPIRNLEKAGALIAAEIDRLLRARSDGEA